MTLFKKYLHDTSGNIAMLFAISTTALLMVIGVAYDFSAMTSQKKTAQDMADMAVLAAAQSGMQTEEELQLLAEQIVNSNAKPGVEYTTVLTISPENYIQVSVSRVSEKLFMKGFGYEDSVMTTIAQAPPRGEGKINLAMVLDVTGSMEGDKLTALQTAADELVDTFDIELDGTSSGGNVQMSVVPFSRYVQLPTSYLGQSWLEVEETGEHCWDRLDRDASTGCEIDDDDEDGGWECDNEVYYEVCEELTWNGCMGSRVEPWNARDYVNVGQPVQGFAGGGSCHSELLPMTTSLADVKTTIAGLTAEDDTYIPSGLVWGWRTLTSEAPLTEADTLDFNERKRALILMSDGENTRSYGGENESFNGVFHWESDENDADTLTAEICESIKADEITLYTVAFEVTDSDTITMLRNCASDSAKFYDAGSAIALEDAFTAIGHELAEVRLVR